MKMLEEGGDSDLDPDPELPERCVCHHCQEMGTDLDRPESHKRDTMKPKSTFLFWPFFH